MNSKWRVLLGTSTNLLKAGDVINIPDATKYKILALCVTIDANRIIGYITNDSSDHALISAHWGESGFGGIWKWGLSLSGNKLTITSGKEYSINKPPINIGSPENTYFRINWIFGIV